MDDIIGSVFELSVTYLDKILCPPPPLRDHFHTTPFTQLFGKFVFENFCLIVFLCAMIPLIFTIKRTHPPCFKCYFGSKWVKIMFILVKLLPHLVDVKGVSVVKCLLYKFEVHMK